MHHISISRLNCTIVFLIFCLFLAPVWAKDVKPYKVSIEEFEKYKAWLDDPAPFYVNIEGYEKVIPPEVYASITYDIEKMKQTWAEAVGFKAPDVVGKIAPEIKPGKYSLSDKERLPFEQLMWEHMYNRFNKPGEGTPNHVGNFTEFEIVPTRQYYWSLPIAEATLKNMGKTKQDAQGYMQEDTYVAGYPFPRPFGKFKAQQVVYNWQKRYMNGEDYYYVEHILGVNNRWSQDHEGQGMAYWFRTMGRCVHEPFGWYDKRAEVQGEETHFRYDVLAPRDQYGNIIAQTRYVDPNKADMFMIYVNVLRRVRRLSSSDTQDPAVGQDMIYDDAFSFNRKLTPDAWVYEYKVVKEQEFLVPMTWDGSPYIDTKANYQYRNLQFERRPMIVVELKQTDPNYIFSKSTMYFDKETLLLVYIANDDQKGRFYRSWDSLFGFLPEMGQYNQFQVLGLDHLDVHSTWYPGYAYPAIWVNRLDVGMDAITRAK